MSELDAVVETWVAGWALSRGREVQREGRAWRVDLDDRHRSTEWVVVRPSAAETEELATRALATPRSWVTVVDGGTVPGMSPIAHGEHLMRTVLRREAVAVEVGIEERDGVAFATIHLDGREAAHGQVALAGTTAVIDRIKTDPEHRRRGLGRAVMAALTGWAIEQGAVDGLLVASADGFQLYSALGWESRSPLMTFS
jgi:GNAT superfamily N-acetyltransferase